MLQQIRLQRVLMSAEWDDWGNASVVYYWQMWGTTGDTGDDCAEVEVPAPGGGMILRQQPFQGKAKRAPSRRRGARLLQKIPLCPARAVLSACCGSGCVERTVI